MVVKNRRALHAADTKRALVSAAHRLFARRGYAATSLDEICERAGVTKGALYHHFSGKQELFAAVYDELGQELVREGSAAADPRSDLVQQLRDAAQAFLDVCTGPGARRIIAESTGVLGWEGCRAMDERFTLGLLRSALESGVAEGLLHSDSPASLARLLVGLFNEAAMVVASAEDPKQARREVGGELDGILVALGGLSPTR
jgi:AcrR family transcriptional regulator